MGVSGFRAYGLRASKFFGVLLKGCDLKLPEEGSMVNKMISLVW